MGSSDFYVDYNLVVSSIGDEFKRETEQRLRDLAADHTDMIGSAVALEKTVNTQSYDLYRVRIVVYMRPQDIAVIKEGESPMLSLRQALDTLERQIRSAREKLSERDPHRDTQIETVFYDLSADEIYATYAKGWRPEEVVEMNPAEISRILMVEHGLNQDAADFAADQILLVAARRDDGEK